MKDTQAIFSAMLESKKMSKTKGIRKVESVKKIKKESEEAPVEFEGTLLKAQADNDDVMDDVIDNIQVVTDPEKTVDEIEQRADDIQDAIDDTPEGKEAFSDEYVGDKVYSCPVCGESFFADEDYKEGDVCPICKAEPEDGFLCQGVVAATEPEVEEPAAPTEPEENVEEPTEGEGIEDEDEPEAPENAEEPEEDKAEECKQPGIKPTMKKAIKKECEEPAAPAIQIDVDLEDNKVEIKKPTTLDVELDEKSFEDNLNQFAAENYSGTIDNIAVDNVSYDPSEDALCIDCVAECKNGSKAPLTFVCKESRIKSNRAVLAARESVGAFKIESKRPAFAFNVVNENGVIKCESMKYSFTTKHSKAGSVKVEGYCRSRKR